MTVQIHIRPVRPEDDAALMAMYEALDIDDRVARFSSAFHPRPDFYRHLATVGERGGARLVALPHDREMAEGRILGEAGYSRLPNGDGELEVTVERGCRSWLGPYLLDALVEVAAASGVPHLEADVSTADRTMLEMLRSYGSVVVDRDGWRRVRLLFATSGPTASWPEPNDRPRVLVECGRGRRRAAEVVSGRFGDGCSHAVLAGHASFHPHVPFFVDATRMPDRAVH